MNNREQWLQLATKELSALFELPVNITRVQVTAGLANATIKSKVLSECAPPSASTSGNIYTVYINPTLATAIDVLPPLLHELIHVANHTDATARSHKGLFARLALDVGFLRPLTTPHPDDELKATLQELADVLPLYPHDAAIGAFGKQQKGRALKGECIACGFLFRASKTQLQRLNKHSPCPVCLDTKLILSI